MGAGLIVNPRSGGASGKGLALAELLRGNPEVAVAVLDAFHRLPDILDDFARRGVTDLFVSSGDGTVHAIQTQLAERRPFATLPRLVLLPHGTTNMTAADLGFRHHSIEAQAAFIRDPKPSDVQVRPSLRAANPRDGRPRHGMFVGAGAVAEATDYCQRTFNAKGVKGSWATFATLCNMLGRAALGSTAGEPADKPIRPYHMTVTADGHRVCEGDQLLLLATTLERLILGVRPFWGGHNAPIRATVIPFPPPNVLRWTLPSMYGGERRRMPQGSVSVCGDVLQAEVSGRFVMDGEFFDGPANEPLRIETGSDFSYVRG